MFIKGAEVWHRIGDGVKCMSNFYAQDPIAVSAAIATLNELRIAHPELYWAALVDSAFDYPASDHLPYELGGINCYLDDEFAGLHKAAPWLMPIYDSSPDSRLLNTVFRHCGARPMISIVGSRVPLDSLSEHWKSLHRVDVLDHGHMLLRIADTRVLAVLPRILDPAQWRAYTEPLAHWLVLERGGKLAALPMAPDDLTADEAIQLRQRQVDALLQASQPDAIIDLLMETMSDIVPDEIRNADFHKLIQASCELAESHGIENFADTFALAVAACITIGTSNNNIEIDKLLRSRQWHQGELGEKLVLLGVV